MDPTVVIAIVSSLIALLLFSALVLVLLVGVAVMVRARRARERRRLVRSREMDFDEPVETFAPPGGEAPGMPAKIPLLGFFDDEASAAGHISDETAKTEMFQREKFSEYWDNDEGLEESDATEIFSAHGAAGDLAEFAFDDHDDSTGRFSR